jgi:GNAT superfamily N-acetyltransferase
MFVSKAAMAGEGVLAFRELTATAEDLALLRRFHDEVYAPELPDPDERESLANIGQYLELKATGWYGANGYHVLVVESAGQVVGGAIADYLADPNAGVVEFLVVAPARRGTGLGRRLLDRIEALIALDARRARGRGPDWIVAEINDPFRVDLAADSLDPFLRARIWGRWGYRKLDFPYVQPALSDAQRPVRHLLLAAKPLTDEYPDAVPAARVVETLRAYLRWAMRIPEPEANAEYRAMSDHLASVGSVALIGLERYVGHDPAAAIIVAEVEGDGPELEAVLQVYGQAFPPDATALDPSALRQAVCARPGAGDAARYHLWAIRAGPGEAVAGMASFFSLPDIGFGGYIALGEPLRGRGRLRPIVARIEERMRQDRTGARGWLIECTPGSHALCMLVRVGFREIALDYRQPPLPGRAAAEEEAPRLCLAYKEFGAVYASPAVTRGELRAALLSVYRVVYAIDAPERSPFLLDLEAQMNAWPSDAVEWRRPAPEA